MLNGTLATLTQDVDSADAAPTVFQRRVGSSSPMTVRATCSLPAVP